MNGMKTDSNMDPESTPDRLQQVMNTVNQIATGLGTINERLGTMDQQFKAIYQMIDDQSNRIERSINAIATLPSYPVRQKTYHSATEFHSVTVPLKRRLGHMG